MFSLLVSCTAPGQNTLHTLPDQHEIDEIRDNDTTSIPEVGESNNTNLGTQCDECIIGTRSCIANSAYHCVDVNGCNKMVERETCTFTEICEDGLCIDPCADECVLGDVKCASEDTLSRCQATSECNLWFSEYCPDDQLCSEGICKPQSPVDCTDQCVLGAKKCDQGHVWECIESGEECNAYIVVESCTDGASCDSETTTCVDPTTSSSFSNEIGECYLLRDSSNHPRALNIAFVPNDFSPSEWDEIRQTLIEEHIAQFDTVEPYSTFSARTNFYFVNVQEDALALSSSTLGSEVRDYMDAVVESCPQTITDIILVTSSTGHSRGSTSRYSSTNINDPWITLHEFSHSFASLDDTYSPQIRHDGSGAAGAYTFANTDVAGCPKWCSGEVVSFEHQCFEITDEQTCRTHAREPNQWGYRCTDSTDCCVWAFTGQGGSACLPARGEVDTGVGCIEGAGCYLGTGHVHNFYRSHQTNSLPETVHEPGIMGGSRSDPWQFDAVSERAIERKFNCCHSTNPDNRCSEWAESYEAFAC